MIKKDFYLFTKYFQIVSPNREKIREKFYFAKKEDQGRRGRILFSMENLYL